MSDRDTYSAVSPVNPLTVIPIIVGGVILLFGITTQVFDIASGTSPYRASETRYFYGLAFLITLVLGGATASLAIQDRTRTAILITLAAFGSMHALIYHDGWIWVIGLPILVGLVSLYAVETTGNIQSQTLARVPSEWVATVIGAIAAFPLFAFILGVMRGTTTAIVLCALLAILILSLLSFNAHGGTVFRVAHVAVGGILIFEALWIQSYTSAPAVGSAAIAALGLGAIGALFEARVSLNTGIRSALEPVVAATALAVTLFIFS